VNANVSCPCSAPESDVPPVKRVPPRNSAGPACPGLFARPVRTIVDWGPRSAPSTLPGAHDAQPPPVGANVSEPGRPLSAGGRCGAGQVRTVKPAPSHVRPDVANVPSPNFAFWPEVPYRSKKFKPLPEWSGFQTVKVAIRPPEPSQMCGRSNSNQTVPMRSKLRQSGRPPRFGCVSLVPASSRC